ncbi:hypothetical protein TVNIR_1977 [Thioalkalivibrio nitratireducens DSM 14787]|uniref:DUF4124 domain-containing protein n=1 Tax=Thioalkalivibrio nitratireducens (strain DSM 14787 / UNIQEM 213 / ALEN2) TaxID=1255043 RepID=L0DX64_THIND|nr:hypothetical protein TVNIR_1977 [Thioalkalivibrio nitratireducens DSM 14787]
MLFLCLVAAFGPVPPAAAQGIFQWVDEHGRMIYSDRPPPGREYRELGPVPDPSEDEIEAARERAREWRRLADALAEERRQREERAAAREPPWPDPPAAKPPPERSVEIRYYPWPLYRHYRPGGWFPPGHRPPHLRHPPPEDPSARVRAPEFTQPRRAPEFVQPRRAPEFVQPRRAPEFVQPRRAPEFQAPPWPAERRR